MAFWGFELRGTGFRALAYGHWLPALWLPRLASRAQNRLICALLPASFFPMAPPASNIFQIALRLSAPASNKPHPAEKSTPVWLAIWRIWAGFADSQLRSAAFRCNYSYICTLPRYYRHKPLLKHSKSFGPSAPIAYATCVSPPNEAAAWPGCRYPMDDEDAA